MAADSSKIIEFIFQGVDKTSDSIDSITKGLDQMNSGVASVAAPFADITESLLKFEAAMLAVGAAVLGFAINEAVKFESSMFDLQKVLDPTDQSLKSLGETAIGMSNTFGVAGPSVVSALADFKEAGFTASEAIELVNATLTAVNVSELSAAESAQIFRRILAGFGADASDSVQILDILNEVSNKFGTSVGQLGDAMARAAPTAKLMGFSYAELSAVLTPMIEVWQDSSIVGTAFTTVLQRLVGDSKPVVDALGDLGIKQLDTNLQMKSGKQILGEVQQAFTTLPESMKIVVAQELAGLEQGAKMISVFDGLAKTTDVLAVATDSAGSAQKELNIRMEATEFQINKTTEAWRNAAIILGSELLPSFKEVVEGAGALGIAVQNAFQTGAFKPLIDAANAALSELGATLARIAEIFPQAARSLDFTGLLDAIRGLTGEISSIFDGIDLTTPEGLTRVMQAIIDTIESLIRVTKGIAEVLDPMIRLFGEWALSGNQLSPSVKELVGNILGLGTAAAGLAGVLTPVIAAVIALVPLFPTLAAGTALWASHLPDMVATLALWGTRAINLADHLFRLADILGLVQTASERNLAIHTAEAQAMALQVTHWDALNDSVSLIGGTFVNATDAMIANEAAQTAQTQALALQVSHWKVLDDTVSLIGGTFQKSLGETGRATDDAAERIRIFLAQSRELGQFSQDTTISMDLAKKGFDIAGIGVTDLTTGLRGTVEAWTFSGDAAESAGEKQQKALSKTAKEALEAQKAANDFELSWAKIESEEKQMIIQTNAQIAVAQIEAGTERIKAAFESVNTTITSTGETMVGLAGVLANIGSGSAGGQLIIHLMEEENRRREEALELQKRMVEQQIAYLNAVTARLQQGDATIQVTAEGLEPELEAFMFKILERIQVRASAEAQQFLLGL